MNQQLIDRFREIATLYERAGDQFRTRAYRRATATLEGVMTPINDATDLKGLPGFGPSILQDVSQWVAHKTIYRLVALRSGDASNNRDPRVAAIRTLQTVAGIGPKKAESLYDQHNIDSIESLCRKSNSGEVELDKNIRLTLRHYKDLQKRIPHTEVRALMVAIGKVIEDTDPTLSWEGLGSFRRHEGLGEKERSIATSGDIDLLVSHPDVVNKSDVDGSNIIARIIKQLEKTVIHIGILSKGKKKYAGLVQLPGKPVRHVDIRLFPTESLALARLHFTGSAETNARMRSIARSKKMRLSEYALVGKDGVLKCGNEMDVFDHLSIPYLHPHQR